MLHVFQKPNGFTTKCRGSSLEESAMGPGNSTTKRLALESPFFDLISIFIHGPRYFCLQNALPAKVKLTWALDLFTRSRWPHYKMTHKNQFCSGLKATHFVWEIRWGILLAYVFSADPQKHAVLQVNMSAPWML